MTYSSKHLHLATVLALDKCNSDAMRLPRSTMGVRLLASYWVAAPRSASRSRTDRTSTCAHSRLPPPRHLQRKQSDERKPCAAGIQWQDGTCRADPPALRDANKK